MTTTTLTRDAYDRPASVIYHALTVEMFTNWHASASCTLDRKRALRRRCKAIARAIGEDIDTVWNWFNAEGLANYEDINIEEARARLENA